MKTLSLTTVLAALTLAPAVPAVTLDFEDLTGSGAVPTSYAGIDWSSGWRHYSTPDATYRPNSGSSRIYNQYGNLGVIRFSEDVTLDSLWIAGYGNNQFIEGYNNGVKLFESIHMPTGNARFGLVLPLNWSGVDEIRVQSSGWGYGYYVLDDLSFTQQAPPQNLLAARIPQPVPDAGASIALLGLGMGAVMAVRRGTRNESAS